ncbi:MAG: cytochrome c3 family protein [Desulfuromonadaceae bacterium]|nr:cytochrome c3 family protein [Desulfuromonadaceae bacterium]
MDENQSHRSAALDSPPKAKDQAGKITEKSQKTLPSGHQKTAPVPQLFSHTVWAAGNCSACHEGDRRFGFQPGGAAKGNAAHKVFYSGGGMPGNLRQPKNKICPACHTDKTGLRAIRDNIWLHNSTAKGDCLACHDAHQSKQRGVLRRPAEQLCQPCHPANRLAAILMHNDTNAPCLSCHNPHMGKDRHLLTHDYREVKSAAKREL